MQVEVVRLGDAKFVLDNQIESLKQLAETWQEEEIEATNDKDKSYFNGRHMSTLHAIERLEQVKASLERRKING